MDLFRRAEYLADDLAEEQHIRNHLLELCEPGKPVAYVYALWGHQFTQAGYFRVASICKQEAMYPVQLSVDIVGTAVETQGRCWVADSIIDVAFKPSSCRPPLLRLPHGAVRRFNSDAVADMNRMLPNLNDKFTYKDWNKQVEQPLGYDPDTHTWRADDVPAIVWFTTFEYLKVKQQQAKMSDLRVWWLCGVVRVHARRCRPRRGVFFNTLF